MKKYYKRFTIIIFSNNKDNNYIKDTFNIKYTIFDNMYYLMVINK